MTTGVVRDRFVGEIAAFGTTSGDRIVIGRWERSPLGAFTDVMHESASGCRTLHAPTRTVADYVCATYEFDDLVTGPIDARRAATTLSVMSDAWTISIVFGPRTALGWALRSVPRPVAVAPWWCRTVDPIARRVVPGVRTRGTARAGRVESYGARDQHAITDVAAVFGETYLGGLADVDPPVHFGFSSPPRRPSVVAITTTVDRSG